MQNKFPLQEFPIGLVVTTLATREVLMASPYFYTICQQQPQAPERIVHFFTPASKILIESFVMPMLLHQGYCDEIQLTLQTPTGGRVAVLANARVVAGEPELIYWAISTAQQRDSLYQQLVDLRNDLEERAERLEVLSQTDELTGLLNRRAFIDRASSLIKQAQRSGLSYAFYMIDIDHFKRINDLHGHDFGDQVLSAVAKILADNTRDNDILARIGGEEFALMTLDQPRDASGQLAEKLLAAIRQAPILDITVTASLGCTISTTASFEQIYKDADVLLYQAKHQGRNQAICG